MPSPAAKSRHVLTGSTFRAFSSSGCRVDDVSAGVRHTQGETPESLSYQQISVEIRDQANPDRLTSLGATGVADASRRRLRRKP
jgi:hypothetical protein